MCLTAFLTYIYISINWKHNNKQNHSAIFPLYLSLTIKFSVAVFVESVSFKIISKHFNKNYVILEIMFNCTSFEENNF